MKKKKKTIQKNGLSQPPTTTGLFDGSLRSLGSYPDAIARLSGDRAQYIYNFSVCEIRES